ncbi:MAG: hypothetical protein GTO30_12550, partial [Acidobacteria bacterium]|nr:hypothetical protein [Acidobacteriota bacterium]
MVEVDVQVTDRQGKPVRGLTVADFEIFEDGRRVEITNFRVVEGFERPSRTARVEPAAPPLPVLEPAEESGPGAVRSEPAAP